MDSSLWGRFTLQYFFRLAKAPARLTRKWLRLWRDLEARFDLMSAPDAEAALEGWLDKGFSLKDIERFVDG